MNELSLFGGGLTLALDARFRPSGDGSLRVAFESLRASLLGRALPAIAFPAGTERTWLLTYCDDDFRIVRRRARARARLLLLLLLLPPRAGFASALGARA